MIEVMSQPMTPSGQWLSGLRRENDELMGENEELGKLVQEAQQLCERQEAIQSRPPSAQTRKEHENIRIEHEHIRRRAVQCTSRPTSAGSSRCFSAQRPLYSSSLGKNISRPISASSLARQAEIRTPTNKAASSVFVVEIDRSSGATLGMKTRSSGEMFEVTHIKDEGLVLQWNINNPTASIRTGDVILEVNGVRGNADVLFKECKRSVPLRLLVRGAGSTAALPLPSPEVQAAVDGVRRILEIHDPGVLPMLGGLLERFKGRECALHDELRRRYAGETPII